MRRNLTLRTGRAAVLLALALASCSTPEEDRPELQGLRRSMDAAVTRELARAPERDPVKPVTRPIPAVFDELKERRVQLDATGPQVVVGGQAVDLGIDLYGESFPETTLSLQDAVRLAVRNNLGVQGARLQQGVTQAELVRRRRRSMPRWWQARARTSPTSRRRTSAASCRAISPTTSSSGRCPAASRRRR
jgi:hypothetical protein